jgi:hypothetical protein
VPIGIVTLGGVGSRLDPEALPEEPLPLDHFDAASSSEVAPLRRIPERLGSIDVRALPSPIDPDLPSTIPIGVSTIHRYREGPIDVTITAFVPMASAAFPGRILDLNAMRFDERIPDRAIVSDFGRRPCIGVDQRPGTPLDRWLTKIIACLPHGPNGHELEPVLEYLRTELGRILRPRPEPTTPEDRLAFPWDQGLDFSPEVDAIFARGRALGIDDPPLAAGVDVPVIPLERFLDEGRGACLQKALVAALILDRLGFGARLVNGAVDLGLATSAGHAWVELEDGRVLCPTWGLLERPIHPPDLPGEMRIGVSILFRSQRSPYLRDQP